MARAASERRSRRPVRHVGFEGAKQSAKRWLRTKGVTGEAAEERAGAVIASAARKASPAAKRRNPRLKRVRGA